MKKTNYLKGLAAKLALAIVAFGAMLTSCTKEEFNVEYKPSNAQIIFNVTVIDAATNTLVSGATLSGADAIVGNPDIAAGSTTITATYNGVSGSATISYPAISAGNVVSFSTVIMLSSEFEMTLDGTSPSHIRTIIGQGDEGHAHNGLNWNLNASDYFAKFTPSWNFTEEYELISKDIHVTSVALNQYLVSLQGKTITNADSAEFMVSAWAMYRADLTVTCADDTYSIYSKATGAKVATIKVHNPLYKIECSLKEQAIPGHEGHYQHGHGHGENTNAGGGITWAE